jgi:16S rRNA G966 N2-methylase RsmD
MDIYDFVLSHEHEDINRLLLQKHTDIDIKWAVQQIEGRKIAKYKLPFFYAHRNIHYPKKISLEQCSSELTAKYKASLVQENTFIDLTGGFGIDTVFCAKNFKKAIYIEQNPDLVTIFTHNLAVLSIQNIEVYCTDALSFLQQDTNVYSWLYVDPARRNNLGNKVFLLSDCEPNIITHWNLITQKAKNILIKTSPLLDIKHVWQNLPVTATHIVAVKNEVKEVLYLIEQGKNISGNIRCVNITESECKTFTANLYDEQNIQIQYAFPQKYLYEPNKAILKAGLFKAVAQQYSLYKIAPNSHLYTSQEYIGHFMGRIFEVKKVIPYHKKAFQEFNSTSFNIIARNFSDTPEQIAKKLAVRTGGETEYIIATKDNQQKAILILAQRLH